MLKDYLTNPAAIEEKSMQIIEEFLGKRVFPPGEGTVIRRIIHATADFDYADLTVFSPGALEAAQEDLLSGKCRIVTDTQMIVAGVNKAVLASLGGSIECFVGSESVREMAAAAGITRSMANIRYAAAESGSGGIYIIGNAPTALLEILNLADENRLNPSLVIGVPVGFVGAAESKEELLERNIPYISTRGRKGGSTVAVAILNAILYMLREEAGQR